MNRIAVFDGLRGYCALWVAVVHLARLLILHDKYWIPDSSIAVEIFFILSGFVIANLLTRSKEPYPVFLFRRYFRLAPAFIFFCILYILSVDPIIAALSKLDTTQHPVYSVMPMYVNGAERWYIHLPAHITMLHGLLEPWFPSASKVILPEGWTMTIEWQFYIFAPILLLAIQKKYIVRLCPVLIAAIVLKIFNPLLPVLLFTDYIIEFLVGMMTFLYFHKETKQPRTSWPIFILLLLSGLSFFIGKFDLMLWGIFISIAYGHVGAALKNIFEFIFNNRLSNFLGGISYSLYLSHVLVMFYIINILAPYINPLQNPEKFYLVAMPLIIMVSVALSTLIYYCIEKPFIRWSKEITARQ